MIPGIESTSVGMNDPVVRIVLYASGVVGGVVFAWWLGQFPIWLARLMEIWAWAWSAVCLILVIQSLFNYVLGGLAVWNVYAWLANALLLGLVPWFVLWRFRVLIKRNDV